MQTRFFRIQLVFRNTFDAFKNILKEISNFFKKLAYHPKTEQAMVSVRNANRRIIGNLKENTRNWKNRTFDDHGFEIGNEDT